MHYHFRVHDDSDGLWAECVELKGCFSCNDTSKGQTTIDVLKANCEEALECYLYTDEKDEKRQIPMPNTVLDKKSDLLQIQVEPKTTFSLLMRYYRTQAKLTQAKAAKLLGMKNLYSYQRLERKANPTLSTMQKIKDVFPDIPLEQVFN
ncbi:MAG: type II toxin-antitoxin system HicB family antitoxin [Spirochaetaceae bacterium]|jgi:antitoxin HicB|nr:type II toxin-antitoxin system HicB family antitoxin [Spirochaetaceae bacterium]